SKVTKLRIHANQTIHRYHLLDQLINQIENRYHQCLSHPFSTIRHEYIETSNIWNRTLKFTDNGQQFQGEAIDIDEHGYLIVIDEQQTQHKLMSADIEL